MTKTLSFLAATLAALALASAPALAGENDDDGDDEDAAAQVAPGGGAVPSGGVATGLGGTAHDGSALPLVGGLLLVTGAGGLLAFKRRLS